MSTLSNIFPVIVVILIAVVILCTKYTGNGKEAGRIRAKALLTPNEEEFLRRLETAAPEIRFHAQVAMGAMLEPDVSKKHDARGYMRLRGRFSQKIIDYVAQDRMSGEILAIIELDDRTHSPERDEKRDAMLIGAGYQVIRWQSKLKPTAAQIRLKLGLQESQPKISG